MDKNYNLIHHEKDYNELKDKSNMIKLELENKISHLEDEL